MKKLVIFDLDGTLLNTIDDLAMSVNHALARGGYMQHPIDAYRYFVGNGIGKLLERALPQESRTPEQIQRLRVDFLEHYQQHNAELTRPYPGILPLLETLKEKGIRMAVASNKYQQATEKLVAHYFGNIDFCVVFGQRDGVPIKPDAQIIRDILSVYPCTAQDVLYVGDSGVDMLTAHHAGIESAGVLWGFRPEAELRENGACHLVSEPEQIIDLLR